MSTNIMRCQKLIYSQLSQIFQTNKSVPMYRTDMIEV